MKKRNSLTPSRLANMMFLSASALICLLPFYYVITILVVAEHRSLVQNFKEEHRHLMSSIPGNDTMRERFK